MQGSTVTGGTITTISGWKYLLYAITAAFVAKWGYDSYNSFQGVCVGGLGGRGG